MEQMIKMLKSGQSLFVGTDWAKIGKKPIDYIVALDVISHLGLESVETYEGIHVYTYDNFTEDLTKWQIDRLIWMAHEGDSVETLSWVFRIPKEKILEILGPKFKNIEILNRIQYLENLKHGLNDEILKLRGCLGP